LPHLFIQNAYKIQIQNKLHLHISTSVLMLDVFLITMILELSLKE